MAEAYRANVSAHLDRALDTPVFGKPLRVVTAEGLILLKLTAARPQDVADIAALLSSNRGLLDLAWIEQECVRTRLRRTIRAGSGFNNAIDEYYEQ